LAAQSLKILSIDPGINPGVSVSVDGEIIFSANYDAPTDLPAPARQKLVWDEILHLMDTGDFDIIAVEDVSVVRPMKGQFNNHNYITPWMYGQTLLECWNRQIKPITLTPSEWKKTFTCSGKARKDEVLWAVQEICPEVTNLNESDAIGINKAAYYEAINGKPRRGPAKRPAKRNSKRPA
jgi:Holliday junction resolvasome RuvABC endonuclease subunit